MPMTIYKLFASAAGASAASLDIQMDGEIKAMHMSIQPNTMDALDDGAESEVSFLSTASWSSNDTRGSLMIVQSKLGMLTTGGGNVAINASLSSLSIPVAAGERVHLHVAVAGGTVSCPSHAYLYVEDKGLPRVPGRRR